MRQYIKPEIKISMFSAECVSTNDGALALSAKYGNNINTFINNNSNINSIKRNYSFDEAIKFN